LIHPPGDMGFARNADGIALILIAESPKQVIKLVIHLGNPGLQLGENLAKMCRAFLHLTFETSLTL